MVNEEVLDTISNAIYAMPAADFTELVEPLTEKDYFMRIQNGDYLADDASLLVQALPEKLVTAEQRKQLSGTDLESIVKRIDIRSKSIKIAFGAKKTIDEYPDGAFLTKLRPLANEMYFSHIASGTVDSADVSCFLHDLSRVGVITFGDVQFVCESECISIAKSITGRFFDQTKF